MGYPNVLPADSENAAGPGIVTGKREVDFSGAIPQRQHERTLVMPLGGESLNNETLRTLPGDDVRQIMWRFSDRYDLQMVVQSSRAVARGPVARLVAAGARNSHEWTSDKDSLLACFDESGITSVLLEPEQGGYIEGPKNLALALVAFELGWVDAGAATSSLANGLALAPIHERGTDEQRETYYRRCAPPAPGEDREIWRGAFALTEPIPYVGVETGLLGGKVRIAEWEEGKEPLLQVDKRGRFITNMAFAKFVTAAVDSDDPCIKGSCMVILEETDPGTFDRGTPARKLVHQLSSTRDPAFSLRVPASRIIGGYTVKDGVIVPRYNHGEIIEAVFRRTRVTVGVMTSAKLLSAIEPVIRYHRGRFRGGEIATAGSPRYELGLQMKEDALHRLADVWAAGEAGASLGFAAARLFDELDPLERKKDEVFAAEGVGRGTAALKAMRRYQKVALDSLKSGVETGDPMVRFALLDSLANVLCPACKLWNTGYGATMMREAVSLMGGYGITEDCPGFLGHKWMDAQLEATYEGPEAVQRRQLSLTMTSELFLAQLESWMEELKKSDAERPGTGAGALAAAMRTWLWTLDYLQKTTDSSGSKLYHSSRQGVTFPLADALCWLLAAHNLTMDVRELEQKGPSSPVLADGLAGLLSFYTDLCHVQCARAAGEVGRICADLVFGYLPSSEAAEADAAGPAREFAGLRAHLDSCRAGSQVAKERAAEALTKVMIPEALDYPA
jgi:alkylation response protein AidB-like acyl-CoA dehydrogenase